jgi:NAD(P)-dependent dehydrogenase (short-subunit alcohol dehydrogenase family)
MSNKKTWFITGASKGLGLSLVKQLLNQGYQVAATSRSLQYLTSAIGNDNTDFLPLTADLKSTDSVEKAITAAIDRFGKIDVVVNNAGYGQAGSLEELTDKEARDSFDINVFGSLNVIRSVMPHLRKQGSGHIYNISSIGGFNGMFPGFGIYCSTKFAVDGFTEALATEIRSFGITATVVSPGYFRTSFLTADSLRVPANEIAAYKEVREAQSVHQHNINGNQPGDPEKAVAVMIKVAESQNPPLHLLLGQDAYNLANAKMDALKKDMDTWKALATATDLVEVAAQ